MQLYQDYNEDDCEYQEQPQYFSAFFREQLSNMPWWVLSIVVHLIVISLTSLIVIEEPQPLYQLEFNVSLETEKKQEKIPEIHKERSRQEIIHEKISMQELPREHVVKPYNNSPEESLEPPKGEHHGNDSPFSGKFDNQAIGVGGGAGKLFGDRLGSRKHLQKRGGGVDTESAVQAGLRWLKRHQSPDGRWDSDGFIQYCGKEAEFSGQCQGIGDAQYDPAMTALAALCFLGSGHTTTSGEYKNQVKNAVRYLISSQDEDGCFGSRQTTRHMYNHAIATLAIVEAYALSNHNPMLKTSAVKAIDFLAKAQTPGGGWRYTHLPGEDDTSVMGWCVMALKLAQDAGIAIPSNAFAGAQKFLQAVTDTNQRSGYRRQNDKIEFEQAVLTTQYLFSLPPESCADLQSGRLSEHTLRQFEQHGHPLSPGVQIRRTSFRAIDAALGSSMTRGHIEVWRVFDRSNNREYQISQSQKPDVFLISNKFAASEAMTAVAMTSRVFMNIDRQHPSLLAAAGLLGAQPPAWARGANGYSPINYYYWYYGTLAMYQMSGEYWLNWNSHIKRILLEHQQKQGCENGSWPPIGKRCQPGGRIYATTLSILSLEIYYRYGRIDK